jgi:hypothetical protein
MEFRGLEAAKIEIKERPAYQPLFLIVGAQPHGAAAARGSGPQNSLAREFVSHPVNGQNVLRMTLIGFQLLSQPGYVNVDGPR